MGSSSSSPLDIVAGVATGGIYTVAKSMNDSRLAGKRAMRSAADQQRDAMVAQEGALKKQQQERKNTAANNAMRNRLVAQRGYARANSRGGTILTSPTGVPGSSTGPGGKILLGS